MPPDRSGPAVLGECPYPGLAPYGDSARDASLFFGRSSETRLIVANLVSSPLTVLYGPSGVGKSSVLRAAVMHRLRAAHPGAARTLPVIVDDWRDDPVAAIVTAVAGEAARQGLGPGPDDMLALTLDEALVAWEAAAGARLLLILDQFEEYFLYHPPDSDRMDWELPEAIERLDVGAHFLISLREDALAGLDRFEGRVADVLESRLALDLLSDRAARSAIEGPIERYNDDRPDGLPRAQLGEGLADAVLHALHDDVRLASVGQGAAPGRSTGVEPAYLQLVMRKLWEREAAGGSAVLRASTLEDMGGRTAIMRAHVDSAVGALPRGEQDVALRTFQYLVTPSGAKIAYSASDLAAYAGLDPARVAPVLERLSAGDLRILRTVPPPPGATGPPRYEIFHDILGPAILDWRTRLRARRMATRAAALTAVLLALVVAAAAGLQGTPLVQQAELPTVDLRFAVRGDRGPDPRVALVGVDAQAAAAHGGVPLPRALHAELLDRLFADGARAVAYDIEFEKRRTARENKALQDAIKRAGPRVVLGSFAITSDGRGVLFGAADASGRSAYTGLPLDSDGAARRIDYGAGPFPEALLPTLAVKAAAAGGHPVRRYDGSRWIDFRGREGTFRAIPFDDVLSGAVPASAIRGRIVVVGTTAPEGGDVDHPVSAPGRRMSGPEVHANAISTLLDGDPLRSSGPAWLWIATGVLGLIGALCARRWGARGALFAALAGVAYLVVAQVAFNRGWVIPIVGPLVALAAATLAVLALRYATRSGGRARGRHAAPATTPEARPASVPDGPRGSQAAVG